eukprot:COSAG06_NODE_1145_length_10532_cov_16.966261_11_plen_70_part_00
MVCQDRLGTNARILDFLETHTALALPQWHPWSAELKADWTTMTGVELYDYRQVRELYSLRCHVMLKLII